VGTGFPKRSCSNKKLERDDDSKKSHPALACSQIELDRCCLIDVRYARHRTIQMFSSATSILPVRVIRGDFRISEVPARRACESAPPAQIVVPIDPTGKSPGQFFEPSVQPLSKKYSDFPKAQITLYPQPSRPTEGRCATSRNAERDAVDAGCALDGRCSLRTAKSCGPDAPTLASSS